MPADLIGRIETEAPPSERRYLQIDLLRRAVEPDDKPLLDYVEYVAPRLLEEFSLITAKGGAGKGYPEWNPKWSESHDQSMLSHILNGIFPTLRIMRQSGQPLSDLEERLYLIGYTLHDLDKVARVRNLSVADLERKEQFLSFLRDWLDRLNVRAFLPNIDDHLEDLAWLILNTQSVWGANRNLSGFALTLNTRRLGVLQEMCTFSDKIAYFVKAPSDAARRDDLRDILLKLSGGKFEFGYHQIAENKGMLTNVINNTLLALLRDELGWLPLLFFPTGVVYLRPHGAQVKLPSIDTVAEKAEIRLRTYCQTRLEQGLMGFNRGPLGLKFPDYYRIFFSTAKLLKIVAIGCFQKIADEKTIKPQSETQSLIRKWQGAGKIPNTIDPENCPASAGRLAKIVELQESARENEHAFRNLDVAFEPDTRVDQLAEFLDQVQEIIGEIVGKEQVTEKILEALDLVLMREQFSAIPTDTRTGGVPLHWYFAAGKYFQQQKGLSPSQMRKLLDEVADKVCEAFREEIVEHDAKGAGFATVRNYVGQVVDINAGVSLKRDFARELDRYESTKRSRKSEAGCSLCSSSFPTVEQAEPDVIFKPQVYTGKRPLGASGKKMVRGICELCKAEMMLRQVVLRSRQKLAKGEDWENRKIKWIYLYPSYFFTTETARFVREAYLQLRNLNFFDVRRALSNGMKAADFLGLNEVMINDHPIADKDDPLFKMEFDPNDMATFYFCGIPTLGKKPTDTASWAIPTFVTFLMSVVFNAKVVVSESIIPLFASGEEWKETVRLDAPHGFVTHLLGKDRFRLDEVLDALRCLASVYDLNVDVFKDGTDPKWTRLAGVARDLDTDKFYVFHYLRMWQRRKDTSQQWRDRLPPNMASRYLQTYFYIGGEKMSLIQAVGERCFRFYGPDGFASNAILRAVSLVEDVIINSPPEACAEDIRLQMRGEVLRFMGRVGNKGGAKGFHYLPPDKESIAIADFVEFFFKEVFLNYCNGERALLRDRRNRFNAGVEAWYQANWRRLRDERPEKPKEETTNADNQHSN